MLHNTLHIQSNNYNASTNTPALTTTTGYNDNIFQVTTQGIQTINGVSSFCGVGDQIIVSNAVSQFYVVLPVQYNAATGAVGALAVTITQLQQVGRIITISVAGTQTINGVSVAMVVGQAWEYNGSSWLNITNPFATQAQVNAGVVNNLPLAPSTFAASSQLAALAPLASPAFTGIPTAPTAALGTNTTQVASTAFVLANANTSDSYATQAQVNAGVVSNLAIAPSTFAASSQLAALAPLASPAFTGIPTAPTAALGTNTTQVASTAFVLANTMSLNGSIVAGTNLDTVTTSGIYIQSSNANATLALNYPVAYAGELEVYTNGSFTFQRYSTYGPQNKVYTRGYFTTWGSWSELANIASPALTGTPTAPTAAVGTNTTQLATTAFVQSHIDPGNYAQLAANNTFTGTNTFPCGSLNSNGIAYSSPPAGSTSNAIKLGWSSPRLMFGVDGVVPTELANLSDVTPQNGGGIIASGSGWVKFANGLIQQWGSIPLTNAQGNATISYAIGFTAVPYLQVTPAYNNGLAIGMSVVPTSTAYSANVFMFQTTTGGAIVNSGGFYFAIGY